jgi:hypothetical protein
LTAEAKEKPDYILHNIVPYPPFDDVEAYGSPGAMLLHKIKRGLARK